MTVTDLVEFLRARLDEDEQVALATGDRAWSVRNHEGDHRMIADADGEVVVYDEGAPSASQAAHIARHDPARVLADVAAKRQILEWHQPRGVQGGPPYRWACKGCDHAPVDWQVTMEWPCPTVRLLASVHAGHPDFDPAWAVPG